MWSAARRSVGSTAAAIARTCGLSAIGSPIGKAKINDSWDAHFERFKIAVDAAEYFAAPLLRLFSYYPPEEGGAYVAQHLSLSAEKCTQHVALLPGTDGAAARVGARGAVQADEEAKVAVLDK